VQASAHPYFQFTIRRLVDMRPLLQLD